MLVNCQPRICAANACFLPAWKNVLKLRAPILFDLQIFIESRLFRSRRERELKIHPVYSEVCDETT